MCDASGKFRLNKRAHAQLTVIRVPLGTSLMDHSEPSGPFREKLLKYRGGAGLVWGAFNVDASLLMHLRLAASGSCVVSIRGFE